MKSHVCCSGAYPWMPAEALDAFAYRHIGLVD
jgi:hypothetical protein